MRQHRLNVVILLAACLGCSWSFLRAERPAQPIVGRWELVGFGEVDGNVGRPDHLIIAIDASGRFDYQVWSDGDAEPFKLSGQWAVMGDVLQLLPQDRESLKAPDQAFRVEWDGATLVLHPMEAGNRDPFVLRFANRVGRAQ